MVSSVFSDLVVSPLKVSEGTLTSRPTLLSDIEKLLETLAEWSQISVNHVLIMTTGIL